MKEIYKKVLLSIYNQTKKQGTSAYFEIVCSDVFEEFNKENEIKLNKILEDLEKENRILINGDRIVLRKSDFLVADFGENEIEKLNSSGLEFTSKAVDIGHGCNIPFFSIELFDVIKSAIGLGIFALEVGATVNEIKGAVDGLKLIKGKIKEALGFNDGDIYYSEDMLQIEVVNKILKEYEEITIDRIEFVNRAKFKVTAAGMFAVNNSAFPTEELEGSPEYIEYIIYKVWIKDLDYDYDLVRCEILSNSKIISFQKTPMILGNGLNSLE